MPETVWQSTDGNWYSAASWSNGVPAGTGWTAIFDGSSQASVTSGFDNGLANEFDALIVLPEYEGNIAYASRPLLIYANRVIHKGSGSLHMTGKSPSGVLGLGWVLVDSPNQTAACTITGEMDSVLSGVMVLEGHVTVAAACEDINEVIVSGPNAFLRLLDDGTPRKVTKNTAIRGGMIESYRTLEGAVSVNGHLAVWGGVIDAHVNQQGGLIDYRASLTNPGTSNRWFIHGGVTDLSRMNVDLDIGRVVIGPAGDLILDPANKGGSIRITDLRESLPAGGT